MEWKPWNARVIACTLSPSHPPVPNAVLTAPSPQLVPCRSEVLCQVGVERAKSRRRKRRKLQSTVCGFLLVEATMPRDPEQSQGRCVWKASSKRSFLKLVLYGPKNITVFFIFKRKADW